MQPGPGCWTRSMSEIANFTTRCIAFVLPTILDLAVRGLVGLNSHQGKMTRLRHSVRRSSAPTFASKH